MGLNLRESELFIEQEDHFLLTTHVKSDADGLGTCLAFARLLRSMGKRADIGLPEAPADQCYFLEDWGNVRYGLDLDLDSYRSIIVADCPSLSRIGPLHKHLNNDVRRLNIDHHSGNELFGDVNVVASSSSTCELFYHLAMGLGAEIDDAMAAQIYTGILFDTGGFRFSLTTPSTFEVAADLVRRGARLDYIADHVFGNTTLDLVRQRGQAIRRLELHQEGLIAVMQLDWDAMRAGDPDEVVNYGLMIKGVEVAILLKEQDPNCYRISLRSRASIDVARIARAFGGGGHARAAGLTLEGKPDEVTTRILTEISQQLV